jgi:hypothetical protein
MWVPSLLLLRTGSHSTSLGKAIKLTYKSVQRGERRKMGRESNEVVHNNNKNPVDFTVHYWQPVTGKLL